MSTTLYQTKNSMCRYSSYSSLHSYNDHSLMMPESDSLNNLELIRHLTNSNNNSTEKYRLGNNFKQLKYYNNSLDSGKEISDGKLWLNLLYLAIMNPFGSHKNSYQAEAVFLPDINDKSKKEKSFCLDLVQNPKFSRFRKLSSLK